VNDAEKIRYYLATCFGWPIENTYTKKCLCPGESPDTDKYCSACGAKKGVKYSCFFDIKSALGEMIREGITSTEDDTFRRGRVFCEKLERYGVQVMKFAKREYTFRCVCGEKVYRKFCGNCGRKTKSVPKSPYEQAERAINYAMGTDE